MARKKNPNFSERAPLSGERGPGGDGKKGRNLPKIPLHAGAEPHQFKYARELRREMTEAEKILWEHLRARRFLNLKVRRQHPILDFIADFYCHELLLIVEADGGYHEERDVKYYDKERTKEFNRCGITIVRFTNEEILNDLDRVLKSLKATVVKLKSDLPLPKPLSFDERAGWRLKGLVNEVLEES